MVRYMLRNPKCQDWARAAKARGDSLRVHYKHTRETAVCLKSMTLARAKTFLKNVIKRKEIVPYRRHTGRIGRHGQCKVLGTSQGRWPKKIGNVFVGFTSQHRSKLSS